MQEYALFFKATRKLVQTGARYVDCVHLCQIMQIIVQDNIAMD